ncbi:MAG: hypothetical protein SWY16_01790 [Cyanobacteriota bacterium]|nr:hypothetical protein [Cyanobacteriota bacterium]
MQTNQKRWLILFLSSLFVGGSFAAGITQQTVRSSVEVGGNRLVAQDRGRSDSTCVPGSGRRGCAVSGNDSMSLNV